MKEILFRGKRTDNGEWIYGNYCYAEFIDKRGYEDLIIEQPANGDTRRVIPETVGQYTGLTDKNGKRIFEGDVVKVKSWYVVVFEDGAFGLKAYNKIKPVPLMGHINFEGVMREIEVIGNIHDNKLEDF